MRIGLCIGCALTILLGFTGESRADLRHYSSRLLDIKALWVERIAVNPEGDVFVLAVTDRGILSYVTYTIFKLNAAGDEIWNHAFTITQPSVLDARVMAAAPDGGVVLAGGLKGPADFGGGSVSPRFLLDNVFVVKFDHDGAFAWQRYFDSDGSQYVNDVAVDSDGNTVITGALSKYVNFGGGVLYSLGANDMFLAKFNSSGAHVWSRSFGKTGDQEGLALALRGNDRIAVSCRLTSGGIEFGGDFFTNTRQADVVAVVFDGDGSHVWSRQFSTMGIEEASDVALDRAGNVFLCGKMTEALNLGGGPMSPLPGATQTGFVSSYDDTGSFRWAYLLPDSLGSTAQTVAGDDSSECFVMGTNSSAFTFGNDFITPSRFTLLGFGKDGVPLGARPFGYSANSMEWNVDRPRDRVVLVAGLDGPVDFGGERIFPVEGRSLALATLGVQRAARVTITTFDAHVDEHGVTLEWAITGSEPLGGYFLSRRTDASSDAQVLSSGTAGQGPATYLDRDARPGHRYTYRLTVATALGDEFVSNPVSVDIPSAVTALEQNAPNPFNPLTTFHYSLAAPAHVRIAIYDTSGALVAILDQGEEPAGRHEATWGGHNNEGSFVGSGVYFYRLEGAGEVLTRKMMLLK
ncbi:MAG TPA: FlgD immunoglobulin-like domain containing protein [Candidatus Krumholzibacteria bacterium]|nr:FlgD immunoglobulin-like domain containing protein [Candidatus Krumholzibacteria bacterium]